MGPSPFSIAPPFRDAEDTGSFQLGKFEAMYETLFAESLEGGEISAEERERLNLAASALGLDAERVARLEAALVTACEVRADVTLVDPEDPSTLADRAPSTGAPPVSDEKITLPPPTDNARRGGRPPSPRQRAAPKVGARKSGREDYDDEEGPTLARPKKQGPHAPTASASAASSAPPSSAPPSSQPIDEEAYLRDRFATGAREGDADLQYRAASVLVRRGIASSKERTLFERLRPQAPMRPARALDSAAWTDLLFHPDEDRLAGEVFGVVASAALIGRVSAMRRDGKLPHLDPDAQQDPASSTVSAVRALSWCSATLGMRTPPIYLMPELDAGFEIVTAVPPATRVGARMLSGQSALRLAFAGARHLTWYREEHFVCTLVPSLAYLEDLFLAAILLGGPQIRLPREVRARATVIAEAMHPCLEQAQMERLQRLVARFLARGGVANLKRWARAAEWTSCRAGLLLCGDIQVAADVLASESRGPERLRQMELFWVSDHATKLRAQLGVRIV